jgi:predicted dehydrogenase
MMSDNLRIPRRSFLKAGAGMAAMGWAPLPAWARVLGANDRLNLAMIGCGGMGHSHLRSLMGRPDDPSDVGRRERDNIRVTRVCEVYRRRLNSAIGYTASGEPAAGTMDYREVLDDKDVDAVVIVTPDHWHTKMAIEAMEAGKDVYCEKPLSLTVEQAIQCRDAVRRTGRVLQVGPQATADDRFWKAREAIGRGRIGKVVWSQGSYCRNSREGQFNWQIHPDATPDAPKDSDGYVWWDQWLGWEHGLAERIPWNPDHFFRFRKYWAYNGGVATDLLYHKLAPLLLAISGPDGEYPRRVSAAGGQYIEKDGRDIPDTFIMTVDYPSEHTVVLASVMVNDTGFEDVIRGQFGTMNFGRGLQISEQRVWWREFREANSDRVEHAMVADDSGREQPDPPPGQAALTIDSERRRDLMGNFFDAIRDGAELQCNIDLGCSTMVAIKMGVEAYRTRRTLHWDAEKERVV